MEHLLFQQGKQSEWQHPKHQHKILVLQRCKKFDPFGSGNFRQGKESERLIQRS
jgi:hypothetical protein